MEADLWNSDDWHVLLVSVWFCGKRMIYCHQVELLCAYQWIIDWSAKIFMAIRIGHLYETSYSIVCQSTVTWNSLWTWWALYMWSMLWRKTLCPRVGKNPTRNGVQLIEFQKAEVSMIPKPSWLCGKANHTEKYVRWKVLCEIVVTRENNLSSLSRVKKALGKP